MEVNLRSLFQSKFVSCSNTPTPSIFHSRACLLVSDSLPFQPSKTNHLFTQIQGLRIQTKRQRSAGVVHASEAESSSSSSLTDVTERWLLEPVGDGDTKHIGFKVSMPDAFVIASSEVTVGRLAEKADMVIPVATVSAVHARIQKKEDSLLVTDLDSTNGTFIDDKRLRPGVVAAVSPGSCITFGDTHLAIFRVSKLENGEAPSTPEESEDKSDNPAVSTETS